MVRLLLLVPSIRQAEDSGPLLREFAARSDRQAKGTRWSFRRDLVGRDFSASWRAGRVLVEATRAMMDD